MKAMFKKYLWLWEFIGVALILSLGLVVYFYREIILYIIVGLIFAVLGLLRVVTLIKTTPDKTLKYFYLAEIIINIGAGVTLIILGFSEKGTDLKSVFGYIIGGILYLRSVIYFISTVLRKENTDLPKFIAHIIFITVGTAIIARGGFELQHLAMIILAIAILSAIFVGVSGIGHYRNYRNEFAAKEITKKVKKTQDALPTADEIIHEQDQPIVPKDEIHA